MNETHGAAHGGGCCGGHGGAKAATGIKDPVCGMTVDPATTAHHADHGGERYHFCSAGCRAKFIADPERYLGPPAPPFAAPRSAASRIPNAGAIPARSRRRWRH